RQIRYAEAAANIDCADLLMKGVARELETAVAQNRLVDPDTGAVAKRNTAYAVRLCRQAMGSLVEVLGAHGIESDHPLHKAHCEILAISSHMGLNWENSGEMFGRYAFNLPLSDPHQTVVDRAGQPARY